MLQPKVKPNMGIKSNIPLLDMRVETFKIVKIINDFQEFRDESKKEIDSTLAKVNSLADEASKNLADIQKISKNVDDKFDQLTNDLVNVLQEIKSQGLKGDKGDSPDEEAIEQRLLEKVPKLGSILEEIDVVDIAEKASLLVDIPEIEGEEIVPKLNNAKNLKDLSLSISNIKDWDKKWGDIKAEISRNKGGYHGGGFNNILNALGVVSTGLDNLKFTGSGVNSVTQSGRTVTVDISGGASSTTYTETPSGLINGVNVTYTVAHTITNILSFDINGAFIHPFLTNPEGTANYTFTGNTITFTSPLDSSYAGLPFTIVYN